ncbi:MAG: prepilin-type N-terminal cleavage/methylation domain-containing protein [Candidatus Omnitrophota bacterium]|nr:prepilin-type N-terminal cleavage/methylation domain-containing protein [Candidatus Omnitrophota bacterium]
MKRGFTLLELMIVIIIVGVLATLGITQYQTAIERARGAEARQVISQLRSMCAALYMGSKLASDCNDLSLGIGTTNDLLPSVCRSSHYFRYGTGVVGNVVTFTATRCTSGGKTPQAATTGTAAVATDYSAGTDTWSGTY